MGKDDETADHKLAELVGSVILFAGNVVVWFLNGRKLLWSFSMFAVTRD